MLGKFGQIHSPPAAGDSNVGTIPSRKRWATGKTYLDDLTGKEIPPDFQKASAEKAGKSGKETRCIAGTPQDSRQKSSPAGPPFLAGC